MRLSWSVTKLYPRATITKVHLWADYLMKQPRQKSTAIHQSILITRENLRNIWISRDYIWQPTPPATNDLKLYRLCESLPDLSLSLGPYFFVFITLERTRLWARSLMSVRYFGWKYGRCRWESFSRVLQYVFPHYFIIIMLGQGHFNMNIMYNIWSTSTTWFWWHFWIMSSLCQVQKFPNVHVKAFPCRLFRTSYHTKICTKVKLWVPFCVGVGQSFKWLLKGDKNSFLFHSVMINLEKL